MKVLPSRTEPLDGHFYRFDLCKNGDGAYSHVEWGKDVLNEVTALMALPKIEQLRLSQRLIQPLINEGRRYPGEWIMRAPPPDRTPNTVQALRQEILWARYIRVQRELLRDALSILFGWPEGWDLDLEAASSSWMLNLWLEAWAKEQPASNGDDQ